MRIKAVKASDPVVAAMLQYLQLTALPNDTPIFSDHSSSSYWWVVFDDTHPVAFASLTLSTQWADAGYLSRAGVLPAYRGQGLQKRLIRVREKKARQLGLNWLVTDTTNNPASANSLISCGYKTFTPSKPWGFEHSTYWMKRINVSK